MLILIGRGLDLKSKAEADDKSSEGRPIRETQVSFSCAVFRMRGAECESRPRKDREQESKRFEKCIRFPVTIAGGIHLFPYRTQKLSLHTLIVLGWKRPGRVGRRRIPLCWRNLRFSNTLIPEITERTEARGNKSGQECPWWLPKAGVGFSVRRDCVCGIYVG